MVATQLQNFASVDVIRDERLDVFFWPPSRAGVMSAWWGHVPFAHWFVATLRPSTIVELGTHNGASFAAFCEAVQRGKIPAKCFAVDTWQGDAQAGMYGEGIYTDLVHFTSAHYGAFAELIRATFDEAQPYFADASIDLLHIDGLHTYEAVRHDFENWLPKMSPAGVIMFHDTNVRERDFGVWRLWAELRERFPSFEFTHAHGLGILAVGAQATEVVTNLCRISELNGQALHQVRDRFAQLGARLVEADMARRYKEHAGQLELANGHLQASLANKIDDPIDHELNAKLHEARAEIEQIEKSRNDALSLLEAARQVNQELEGSAQNSESKLSLALADMQRLNVEKASIHSELQVLKDQNASTIKMLGADQVAMKTKLDAVQDRYAKLKLQEESLQAKIALLEAENRKISSLEGETKLLRADNSSLQEGYQQTLKTIYKSTSWRITRPMRALQPRGLLRRLKTILPSGNKFGESSQRVFETNLFDEGFYVGSAEARKLGKAPFQHYLEFGEAAGFAPSAAFDPVYYGQRHPDVLSYTGGLLRHYLDHGRAEGRIARSIAHDVVLPVDRFNASRPCMLIGVHEATRTGAVILSWNLVLEFTKKYNVITLLRRGGPLESQFCEASSASIILSESVYGHCSDLNVLAERVITTYRPQFIVANSVETRNFAPAFEKAGIPCVALVHEFSGSVRPIGVLNELFESASSIVFSARIVAESMMRDYGVLAARAFEIIPQGASRLPPSEAGATVEVTESRLASVQIALSDIDPDAFLVVGLGTITPRKGVEFFVSAAASACRRATRKKLVFAWVGKCYSFDEPYLESLLEQVERSGLSNSFAFLGEFTDLDPVYARADACLLSSRLDPLPNIAIDAALASVPVVCFDQGSGFAEILNESPETRKLVVPYLDAGSAADVLCQLAENAVFLSNAQSAMKKMAESRFDMAGYAARVEGLALSAKSSITLAKQDHATLLASGKFNAKLYDCGTDAPRSTEFTLAHYLNVSRLVRPRGRPLTDRLVRRPLEGFHPLIYAEEATNFDESRDSDPLLHFIQAGYPKGRWQHEVITPLLKPASERALLKVAIHAHFHYPELCADFLNKIGVNRSEVALFITTTTELKAEIVRRSCRDAGFANARVFVVGNCGRDIGPMLTGLPDELFEQYDLIGHFHGKRSPHVEESIGGRWREFLWQHLIGDTYPMIDRIVQAFADDPGLGLVFAEDPHLNGWDQNRGHAEELARRMGLDSPLPAHFDFPQGTMFWVRPAALKPVLNLDLSWDDFPKEPLPIDGTMLHALERLLPFAAAKAGFSYATTYVENHRR